MGIAELREICQASREKHYGKEPIADRVLRFFSIYLTAIIIKIKLITPNLVTIFSLLVGACGVNIIISGNVFIGVLFVYFFLILDACDGEVARYKKQCSPQGLYLDYIAHIIIFSMFLLSLGLSTGRIGIAMVAVLGFLWFEIPINYNHKIYNEYKKSGRSLGLKALPKPKGKPNFISRLKALVLQSTGYVEMITLTLVLSLFGLELIALTYYAIAKIVVAMVNFWYEYNIGLRRLI